MKMYFRFYFTLIFLGVCNASRAQHSTADPVLMAEQTRFEAMIRQDTAYLKTVLDPDLIYIHSNALVETKNDHLQTIASRKIVYQSMQREKVAIRRYGNIAITNGTVLVKGLLNQNPFEAKMLYTAVYRKKRGEWLLLNWQTTRIP